MSDVFQVLRCGFAAVLIAAVLSVAGCSNDETGPSPSVRTAGTATKDVFLRGTVERDGKAVPGATLDVVVVDELKAVEAKVGDTMESFTAATAITDEEGSYTLRLKADDLPSKYFSPGGRDFLNFSINLVAGTTFATWSSTMYPEGQPAVWRTSEEAATADAVMRANFDLDTEKVMITDSLDQKETRGLFVMSAPNRVR
jgi:hypothetical protein